VGGADTRDDAERKVVEAVAFILEGDDDASLAEAEICYGGNELLDLGETAWPSRNKADGSFGDAQEHARFKV
jgi:hypothetical protein